MASKAKQERRRQRAKEVKKNVTSRKVVTSSQAALNENIQVTPLPRRDSHFETISALLGFQVFHVGDEGNPRSFKRMVAAMANDNGPMFKSGLDELAAEGLPLSAFRVFEEDEPQLMDVFEWVLYRKCDSVFLALACAANQDEDDFMRLIEKICDAVEESSAPSLQDDFAAGLFAQLAKSCLRDGIVLNGPTRKGRCGTIWDAMDVEVETERQQAMLQAAIPDVGSKGNSRTDNRL